MISSFLSPDQVFPTRGRVLLEALRAERYPGSGLLKPLEFQPRYPSLGRVVRGCRLPEGSFAILDDEGKEVPRTYYDVFKLILAGEGKKDIELIVDNEVEPLLRERVEAYRVNRTSCDYQLTVEDALSNERWTFLCSDVKSYGWDSLAHPTYKLESIPTFMLDLFDPAEQRFKLFYIAPITSILGILECEPARSLSV